MMTVYTVSLEHSVGSQWHGIQLFNLCLSAQDMIRPTSLDPHPFGTHLHVSSMSINAQDLVNTVGWRNEQVNKEKKLLKAEKSHSVSLQNQGKHQPGVAFVSITGGCWEQTLCRGEYCLGSQPLYSQTIGAHLLLCTRNP